MPSFAGHCFFCESAKVQGKRKELKKRGARQEKRGDAVNLVGMANDLDSISQ